jgi:ClpP class serine protease
MSEFAVLGPVDPQVGRFPAVSLLKAVAKKSVDELDDETLILADQAEMAVAQVRESLKELLEKGQSPEKADELARLMVEGRWTHDFPITFETAKSLGFPVSSEIPKEVLDLMALFPQPVRQTPAVEYLPYPRKRKPS